MAATSGQLSYRYKFWASIYTTSICR